jgi:predicted ATP-grasp superfamily ATP-dependent carboligase
LYKVSKVPNKISDQLFFEGAKMLETSLKFPKFQKVDTNSLTSKKELDQTSNFSD